MKKRLTILVFMLFAVVGGFFGCASPYAKTNIDITSSLMQNGAIEITRDVNDEELNVITLTSTVTNAPKNASTDSIFISSKPEVVSVVETVNVATGVTEAKLIAKSAGEVIIRVRTEGKSKDVKITVLEGVRDIKFADDYSPAFYRGAENEINESKILYNLNSPDTTQPSLKNRGVSFAFVGDNTNNKIGSIEGNKVTLNQNYAESTVRIRATSLTNETAHTDITINVYKDIDINNISVSLVNGNVTFDDETGIYGMVANNNNKNKAEFLVSYPNNSNSYRYKFAYNSANDGIASVEDYVNSSKTDSDTSNLTIRANGFGEVSIYGKIYIEGHYAEAKTFSIVIKSDLEPTLLKILSADGSEVGEDVEIYAGGYRSYLGAFVYPSVVASKQRVKVYIPSSVIYTDNGDDTFSGFVDVYSTASGDEKLALNIDGSYAVAEINSSDSIYFTINNNATASGTLGSFDIKFEVVGYESLSRVVRIKPAIAIETINIDSVYAGSENVLYIVDNKYHVNTSLTTGDDLTELAFSLSISPSKASKVSLGVRVYAADSLFNVLNDKQAPLEIVNFSSEALYGFLKAVDSGFAIVEFYSNTTFTRVYVTIYKEIESVAIGVSSYDNITDIKADDNGTITDVTVSQGKTAELSLNVTPIDSAEFVNLGIVKMDGISVSSVVGNDGKTLTYDNGDLELVYNLLNRSIKVTPKASKTTVVSMIISGAGSVYIVNFNVKSFVAIDAGSVALLDSKGQEVTFVNTYYSQTVGMYEVASESVVGFNFTFAGVEGYSLAGDYEVEFSLSNSLYGNITVDGLNCVFTADRWSEANYGTVGTVILTASVTQHGITYESKVLIYVNKAIKTSSINFTEISSYNYLTSAEMADGISLSTSVATTNSHNKNVSYVVLNSSGTVLINSLTEKLSYGEVKSISLERNVLTSTLAGEFTIIAFTNDSITSSFDVKNLTSINVNNLPSSLVYSIATIYIADGTQQNPYMIYSGTEFNSMTADNFYRLGANISLEYKSSDNMVESVKGLDGNGYVVSYTSGIYKVDGGNAYAGLIYNANDSIIKNLTVNAQISLSDFNVNNIYVGGLVANSTNATISNVKVNAQINIDGSVANAYIGGLAGRLSYNGSNEGLIDSPIVTGFINTANLTSNLLCGAIVGSISAENNASILSPFYNVDGITIPAGLVSNVNIEAFNKSTLESFSASFRDDYSVSGINLEKYSNTQMIAYLNGENAEVDLHTIVDKTISPVGDGVRYNYTYTTSDSNVAVVDANGKITFKGYGLVVVSINVTAGVNVLTQDLEFYVLPVGYVAIYNGDTQVAILKTSSVFDYQGEYNTIQAFTLKLVDSYGNIVDNFENFVKFKIGTEFVNSFALKLVEGQEVRVSMYANIKFSDVTETSKLYENGNNVITVKAMADISAFDATATISKSSFNINENVTLDVTVYTYDKTGKIRVQIYKNGVDASSNFVLTKLSESNFDASSSSISASYNISIANYLNLTKAERQSVYGDYEIRILGKAIVGQPDKVLKKLNITVNPAMLTGIDLLNYASESIKAEIDAPNVNQYDINEEPNEYIYLGYSSLIKVHLTAENADISEISVTSSSEYAIVGQYYLSSDASNLTKEDRVTPITGGFKTTNIYSEPGEVYNGWIYIRVSLSANYRGASNIIITVKAIQDNGNNLTKSISLTPMDKISLSVSGSTYVADRTEFTLTFKAEKTLDYNELYSVASSGKIDSSDGVLNLISFDESKQSATYSIFGATLGSSIKISFTYSKIFMGIETSVSAYHTVRIVKYVIDGVKFVANYGLVDSYGDSIEYEINNYSVVAYNQFIPGIRLTGTWSRTYDTEITAFENALNNFTISSYNKDESRISSVFKAKNGSVLELGKKSDEYSIYKDLSNRSVRTGSKGFTTIQMMAFVPEITTSNAAINAQVRYYYENGEFFLVITGSVGSYHVFGLRDGAYKTFDTDYSYASLVLNKTLNFAIEANSSTDSPIPVNSLDDLISLNTAGNNLILTSDIYITSLKPINAVFDSLDGNNHNIYIYPNAFDGYVGNLVEGKYNVNSNVEDEDKTLGDENGKASIGLFSTISENSIVKNINIKLFEKGSATYVNENGELIEYTEGGLKLFNKSGLLHEGEGIKAEKNLEISFGLLAGTNYGTITNSSISYFGDDDNSKIDISGELLDSANGYYNVENGIKFSYFFRSLDTNQPKGGNIGSLVGSNEGYLTNSRSCVSLIVAQIDKYSTNIIGDATNTISTVSGISGSYNIGGLVGVNSRTISSSYFKNANILSFSNASSLIGGFVGVNDLSTSGNNAMINLSYVEGGFITERSGEKEWKYNDTPDEYFRADANFIITSGTVGGFVAVNNSVISNSYSNIDLSKVVTGSGNSSPTYAGFVHTNTATGRIEFCYTTSNILIGHETVAPFVGRSVAEGENNKGEIYNSYSLKFGRNGGYPLSQAYTTELSASEFSIETSFNGFSFKVEAGASRSEAASWEMPSVVNPGETGSKTVYIHVANLSEYKTVANSTIANSLTDEEKLALDKLYKITFISREDDGIERNSAYYSYKYNSEKNAYYYVGEGNGTHRLERAIKTIIINDGTIYYSAIVIGKPSLVEANTIAKSQRVETARVQIGEGDQTKVTYYFSYIENSDIGLEPLGNKTNPIIISTIEEFSDKLVNAAIGYNKMGNDYYYRLIRDISFDDSTVSPATSNIPFYGVLSGNGMKISNARINQVVSDESDINDAMGLFGKIVGTTEMQESTGTPAIRGAGVSDLTIELSEMYANTYVYAGALAGVAQDAQIYNVKLEKVSPETTIHGRNVVGGVVGYALGDTQISNIKSEVSAMSTYGRAERAGAFEQYSIIKEFRSTSDRYVENKFEYKNDMIISHMGEYNWLNSNGQGDSTISYVGGLIGVADIYYEIQYNGESFVRKNSSFFIWSSSYSLPSTSYGILKGAYVGGLVGYNSSSTTISDCEYEIKGYRASQTDQEQRLEARDVAGGLVSENRGTIYNSRVVNLKAIDNAMASSGTEGYTSYFGNYGILSSVGSSNEDVKIDKEVFNTSTAKIVGGMVGINDGGLITNSYVTASVKSTKARVIGGVVGVNIAGSLKNIYVTGTVIGKSNETNIEKWTGGVIGVNTTFEESLNMNPSMGLQNIYAFNAWEDEASVVYEKSLNSDNKISFGAVMGENNNGNIYVFALDSNVISDKPLKNETSPIIFYLDVMNYQNYHDNSNNFKFVNPISADTTGVTGATITYENTFKLSDVSVWTDDNGNLTNASGEPVSDPVLKAKIWSETDKNADGTVKNSAINQNLNEFFINNDETDKMFSYYQNAIYANLLNDLEDCWSLDKLRILPLVKITNQPLGGEERPYQIISQQTFETYIGLSATRSERTYFEVARDFELDTTYMGDLDLTNAIFDGCDYTITVHSSLFNEIDEYSVIKNLNIRVAGTDEHGSKWIITPTPDYNDSDEYYWGALCNRLYGEANFINLVDDSVINLDLSITNNASTASVVKSSGYSGKVAYASASKVVTSYIGGLIGNIEDGAIASGLHSYRLDELQARVGAKLNVSTTMAKNKVNTHNAYVGGMVGRVSQSGILQNSYSEKVTVNFNENALAVDTATLRLALGGVLGYDDSRFHVNVNTYFTEVNATLNGGHYGDLLCVGGTYGVLIGDYNSNTANDVSVVFNQNHEKIFPHIGGLAGRATGLSSVYQGLDVVDYPNISEDQNGNHPDGLKMLGNVSVENNGSLPIRAYIGGVFGSCSTSESFAKNLAVFENIEEKEYQANTEATLSAQGNIESYIGGLCGMGAISTNNVHLENVTINANAEKFNNVGGFVGEWSLNNSPKIANSSVGLRFNQGAITLRNQIGGFAGSVWNGESAKVGGTISNFTTNYLSQIVTKTTFDATVEDGTTDITEVPNSDSIGGLIGRIGGESAFIKGLKISGDNVNNNFTVTSSASVANIGYGIGLISNVNDGLIDIGDASNTLMVNYNHAGTLNIGGTVGSVYNSKFAISKSTNVNLQVSAYANGRSTATSATNTLNMGGVVGVATSETGSDRAIYMGYNDSYEAQTNQVKFNNNLYLNVQSGKTTLSLGGLVGKTEQNININNSISDGGVDLKNVTYSSSVGYIRGSNAVFNSATNPSIGGLIGSVKNENSPTVSIKNNTINKRVINTSARYVGGAIGYSNGGLMIGESDSTTSFINNGSITSSGGYVGGVIGGAYNTVSTIRNVINRAEIKSFASSNVGGIIGELNANNTTIYNATNSGTVNSNNLAGGLIGYAQSKVTINDSSNTGSITGVSRAGGIICDATKEVTLSRCVNKGNIEATTYSTGATVRLGGLVAFANSKTIITACQNIGRVEYKNSNNYVTAFVGGFVGYASGSVNVNAQSSVENATQVNFSSGHIQNNSSNISSASGKIVGYANADLVVAATSISDGVYGYQNVGGVAGKIVGETTISQNVTVNGIVWATSGVAGGLVGSYAGDQLNIGYVSVSGKIVGNVAGGIVSQLDRGFIKFISSLGATNNAEVCGNAGETLVVCEYAGGAVGKLLGNAYVKFDSSSCKFTNNGSVKGSLVSGGFIGYSSTASTTQLTLPSGVVNNGAIGLTSSTAVAGGIIGKSDAGSYIINASNTGSVTSKSQAGGIIGLVNAGTITLETAINTGKITQTATSGYNSTTPYSAGGIVGAVIGGTVYAFNCLNGMSSAGIVTGGEIATVMFNTSGSYYTANTTAIIHLGGIVGYIGSANVTINNHRSYTSSGDITKSDGLTCMTKNYGRINNYSNSKDISAGGIVGYINDPSAGSIKAQNHGRVFSLQGYAGGFVGRLAAKQNFNASSRFSIWSDSSCNYGNVISHSSQALLLDGSVAGSKFTYLNNEGTARYYYGGQAGGLIGSASGYIKIDGVSNGSATKDETWIYSLGTTGGLISVAHTDSDILLTATISNTAKVQTGWSNPGGFIGNVGGVVTFSSSGTFTNHGTVYSGYMAGGFISNIISGSQVTLNNCTNTGEVTSNRYDYEVSDAAAGIVAFVGGTVTINNCSNSGTITGGNAGGLVGQNVTDTGHSLSGVGTVTITNSTNSGRIESLLRAASGGLMGYVANHSTTGLVTIEKCSNTGEIISPEKAGGAIGWTTGKVVIKGFTHSGNNAYVRATGTYRRNTKADGTGVTYYCGAAGGVVGYVESGSLTIDMHDDGDSVTVSSPVQSNGTAQHGLSGAGGIIGSYNSGILNLGEMSVDATIGGYPTVQSAGGLIGRTSSSLTIDSSTIFTFTGTIEKAGKAGGVIGRSSALTLDAENITLNGSVNGINFAGGVIGMLTGGEARIINAQNYSTVTATNTTVTMSNTSESQSTAGGIIGGIVSDSTTARNAVLIDCINGEEITAAISAGGAVGLTYYSVEIDGFETSNHVNATGGIIKKGGYTYEDCGSAGGVVGISEGEITINPEVMISCEVYSAGKNSSNQYSASGGLIGSVLNKVNFVDVTEASDIYIEAIIGGESADSAVGNAGGLFGLVNSNCEYKINYVSFSTSWSNPTIIQNAVNAGGLIGGSFGNSNFWINGSEIYSDSGYYVSALGTGSAGGLIGWLDVGPSCKIDVAGIEYIVDVSIKGDKPGTGGGIIGTLNATDGTSSVTINECVYLANINTTNSTVGGIVGSILNAGTIKIDSVGLGFNTTLSGRLVGGVIGLYDPAANAQLEISNVITNDNRIGSKSECAGGVIGSIGDSVVSNGKANAPTLNDNYEMVGAGAMVKIFDTYAMSNIISAQHAGGLIGMSDTYVVLNNVILNAYIDYESNPAYSSSLGGFIGVQKGTTIFRNCELSDGSFSSISTNIYNMGGFIGEARGNVNINAGNSNSVYGVDFEPGNAYSRVGGYIGYARNSANIQLIGSETSPLVNEISLSGAYVGGFVGYADCETITISDCINYGEITSTDYTGGIIGCVSCGTITISDCINYGAISSTYNVGGLIGQAYCEAMTMNNCENSGAISSTGSEGSAGGIVGYVTGNELSISNCINSDDISGSMYSAGGIVGYSDLNVLEINYCENSGYISGSITSAGGIVGESISYEILEISDCINFGNISATYSAGGIVGYAYYNEISTNGSINTGEISSPNYAGDIIGASN